MTSEGPHTDQESMSGSSLSLCLSLRLSLPPTPFANLHPSAIGTMYTSEQRGRARDAASRSLASQELEALLGQMQAEDPGDRPDLQVSSQACPASPQEIP